MAGAISIPAFLFALSSLVTGLTSIGLAAFVLFKNPRSLVNRTWVLFCTTVSVWGFCGIGIGLGGRSTLRSIGEGVITTDTGGRVVLIEQAAESLTGWNQQEAAGRYGTRPA